MVYLKSLVVGVIASLLSVVLLIVADPHRTSVVPDMASTARSGFWEPRVGDADRAPSEALPMPMEFLVGTGRLQVLAHRRP